MAVFAGWWKKMANQQDFLKGTVFGLLHLKF
jgi:hypothetical protein